MTANGIIIYIYMFVGGILDIDNRRLSDKRYGK